MKKIQIDSLVKLKPSELLATALKDLIAVERRKKFKIDMSNWISEDVEQTCYVCLAGACLVRQTEFNNIKIQKLSSSNFSSVNNQILFLDNKTRKVMYAINELRSGHVFYGLHTLKISKKKINNFLSKYPDNKYITPYDEDKIQFKKDIRQLIKNLQSCEL